MACAFVFPSAGGSGANEMRKRAINFITSGSGGNAQMIDAHIIMCKAYVARSPRLLDGRHLVSYYYCLNFFFFTGHHSAIYIRLRRIKILGNSFAMKNQSTLIIRKRADFLITGKK